PMPLDVDSNLLGGAGTGIGFGYPASPPVTFNGNYAIRLTQVTFGSQADFGGEIVVNGSAQTLSGTLDANTSFVNPGSTTITGTFGPSSHANVLSGGLSDPNQFLFPNASGISINVDFYFIDATHGFIIETDLNDAVNPSSSVAFGFFAVSTSVCPGCP